MKRALDSKSLYESIRSKLKKECGPEEAELWDKIYNWFEEGGTSKVKEEIVALTDVLLEESKGGKGIQHK